MFPTQSPTSVQNYSSSNDSWGGEVITQNGMGASSYYQPYELTLLTYIQTLKGQMGQLQQGTTLYDTYSRYLNTAMGYLHQVDPQIAGNPELASGWDPLSAGNASGYSLSPNIDPNSVAGVAGSDPEPSNSFPISYQDSTHIVTDEGDGTSLTLNQNDPETRTIDVYQLDNTLTIPSNAAKVSAAAQPDDAVSGATMVVVTYACNGRTRTVKYHNVDREKFNVHLLAPDKTQISLDASLTSSAFAKKVTAHELGEVEKMQGTPPDETDSTTRTWQKNDAVDYYVTEGAETDEIYADTVNITLEDRSQKAEVIKNAVHEYTVIVKDTDNRVIRTVHLQQVTGEGSINFNHLSGSNLKYADRSKDSNAKLKAWIDPACGSDPQLTVNGEAVSPEVAQAKAVVETASHLADQMKDLAKQLNDAALSENVSKEMKDKLIQIRSQLVGATQLVDSKSPKVDDLAKAKKIYSDVKKEFDAMGKDLQADTKYPQWVDDLASYTGTSGDSIISAIKSNYLAAPSDSKEFESWLEKFPPMNGGSPVLDKNFSQFLRAIDSRLASAMDGLKGKEIGDCKEEASEIQDRVVEDLRRIFRDKGVSISKGGLNFDESSYSHIDGMGANGLRTSGYHIESMLPTVVVNGKTYSCFPVVGMTYSGGTPAFPKDFGADSFEFSNFE